MPKHILFDLDGTLIDPKIGVTKCIAYALGRLGIESPPLDDLEWCIGPPLHLSFSKILGGEEKIKDALAYYREQYAKTGIFEHTLYPGIAEALHVLQQGGQTLYVATSKPKNFANQIIDHFGLRARFKAVYGSELDGTRSDKAELIAFILEQEKLLAEDCVMIGDRKFDLIGARKNGMRGVGVGWGYGSSEELMHEQAEKILQDPRELHPYLCL